MIERRSQRRTTPLPFGIAICLMLALVPDARAAAQDVDDDWTVTPEEIEAAKSAPLFQTDDVLELTLYADFNSIRRQDRGEDAEERPALVYVDGERSEATLGTEDPDAGVTGAANPETARFLRSGSTSTGTTRRSSAPSSRAKNRLKLYVTCRPGRDDYEEYIYTEYVIYPPLQRADRPEFSGAPRPGHLRGHKRRRRHVHRQRFYSRAQIPDGRTQRGRSH